MLFTPHFVTILSNWQSKFCIIYVQGNSNLRIYLIGCIVSSLISLSQFERRASFALIRFVGSNSSIRSNKSNAGSGRLKIGEE